MSTSGDLTARAQDIKRCQLCPGKDRKSAAEIMCKNCQVNLCRDCVGPHMVSDPNIKHDVLTFELTKLYIIPPQCNRHRKQSCNMFCQPCCSPFCQMCLSSGSHDNHTVHEISEIYRSRQKMIREDIDELETNITPVYESIVSEIESMLLCVGHKHGERQQSITEFGDKCHKLVDRVIERYLNDSKDIEKKDTDSLLALKSEFQSRQSFIESVINENESILTSSDSSKLLHYTSKNEYFRNVPSGFLLEVPQFNPTELTEQKMCQMIGVIPKTIKTDIPARVLKVVQLIPNRKYVDKPKVIGTVNTGYDQAYGVNCIPNINQFYVWGNSAIIERMNTDGEVLEEIISAELSDLAVTREGYLAYTECEPKRINVIKNGRKECLSSLHGWVPLGICSTSTGDILVVMQTGQNGKPISKVVRYSGSTVTQEIQYDAAGKALYCNPFSIEENKNLDIIVSDSGLAKVVVVDKSGMFRFTYDGNLQSKRCKTFTPCGLTSNRMCHIFIADNIDHVIHIIDQNGQFLLYIENCELEAPFYLSTDSHDNLFVADCLSGRVKIVKLFE